MPAMDQSGHAEASPIRKLLGNGLAGTVPVALFIAVLLVAGCAPTATQIPSLVPTPMATATSHPGQASLPPGLTPGVLDTRPVPAGWTRVLNGQVFNGTATSPADPQTIAGCPLPAQLAAVAVAAPPVLVLSTDGGVTWQSHPIRGADETQGCAVLADTEHAGTYIVDGPDSGACAYETTDAGQTWQTITPPAGYTMTLETGSTSLVGGYLTAALTQSTGTGLRLGQLSPDGTWTILHTFVAGDYPASISVDPNNPAHIYAAMWLSQVRMALIVTTDRGSTWQTVHIWNATTELQVWTATNGRVVVEADVNAKVPHEVWFSPDAGASWREVAANGYLSQAFVEPGGNVLTLYTANAYGSLSGGSLSELNLASGKLQRIASSPAFFDTIFCTTTTGALVCGDEWGTYRLPQAPAS